MNCISHHASQSYALQVGACNLQKVATISLVILLMETLTVNGLCSGVRQTVPSTRIKF